MAAVWNSKNFVFLLLTIVDWIRYVETAGGFPVIKNSWNLRHTCSGLVKIDIFKSHWTWVGRIGTTVPRQSFAPPGSSTYMHGRFIEHVKTHTLNRVSTPHISENIWKKCCTFWTKSSKGFCPVDFMFGELHPLWCTRQVINLSINGNGHFGTADFCWPVFDSPKNIQTALPPTFVETAPKSLDMNSSNSHSVCFNFWYDTSPVLYASVGLDLVSLLVELPYFFIDIHQSTLDSTWLSPLHFVATWCSTSWWSYIMTPIPGSAVNGMDWFIW